MSEPWLYLLAALATFRLARMLALEEGPFSLFARIRGALGEVEQATWLGRGISCPLCVGFWLALLLAALLSVATWQAFLLVWWGIAGGAVLLQKYTEKL